MSHSYLDTVQEAIGTISYEKIYKCLAVLGDAVKGGHTVYVIGNGGSAATASHFANDLTKMAGGRALALADLTPTFLAYGNDDEWEYAFADMIVAFHKHGDVLVAISCSGKSPNIISAVKKAKQRGMTVIGLTGMNGDELYDLADICVRVLTPDIRVQEDCHSVICHALAGDIRDLS